MTPARWRCRWQRRRRPGGSSRHRRRHRSSAALAGLIVLVLVWQFIAIKNSNFPTPAVTFTEAVKLFSDPFYRTGPNDQGIGWNILASLKRVAIGFGLAALVGIPLGFMIGRFKFLSGMFGP